jgi:hypothetical protein
VAFHPAAFRLVVFRLVAFRPAVSHPVVFPLAAFRPAVFHQASSVLVGDREIQKAYWKKAAQKRVGLGTDRPARDLIPPSAVRREKGGGLSRLECRFRAGVRE